MRFTFDRWQEMRIKFFIFLLMLAKRRGLRLRIKLQEEGDKESRWEKRHKLQRHDWGGLWRGIGVQHKTKNIWKMSFTGKMGTTMYGLVPQQHKNPHNLTEKVLKCPHFTALHIHTCEPHLYTSFGTFRTMLFCIRCIWATRIIILIFALIWILETSVQKTYGAIWASYAPRYAWETFLTESGRSDVPQRSRNVLRWRKTSGRPRMWLDMWGDWNRVFVGWRNKAEQGSNVILRCVGDL